MVALLVLLISAAAGLYTAATLAPERLRLLIERRLAEASGGPCRLERLRVVPGLPLKLEGGGLALWEGGLRVDRAVARVSIAAALLGEFRLARLELEGARLRLAWEGAPVPPWLDASDREAEQAREAVGLAPPAAVAAAIESVSEAILEGPLVADTLRVHDSRLVFDGPRGGDSPLLVLEIREGEVFHSRLRGVSELAAHTRLLAGDRDRGALEWHAARERGGSLHLELAASALDLGWLAAGVEATPVRPAGSLSGTAEYRIPESGHATVDVALTVSDFRWLSAESGEAVSPAGRVEGSLRAALDDAHLEVSEAHFAGENLTLDVDAVLARPFDLGANLGLSVRFGDIDLPRARRLLSTLPPPVGERAEAMTAALSGGRLAALGARGAATLQGWRDLLSGHAESLPRNFTLEARLEGLDVDLGEGDRLEQVSAELLWKGDRLKIRRAAAQRGGVPLPMLDLELDGISHLFAADLSRRVPASDEIHLTGMRSLLSLFEGRGGGETRPPRVRLEIAKLEHPALLWPIEDLELEMGPEQEELVADVPHFLWAQVPFRGELRWTSDPEHVVVRFEAAAQTELPDVATQPIEPPHVEPGVTPGPSQAPEGRVWGAGRFEIGPLDSSLWRHEWLRGQFEAVRSEVRFHALEAQLVPRGHLQGSGQLDLGHAGALPYRAEFVARDLDAAALLAQAGLGQGFVTGDVELTGKLEARHEPGALPFVHLSGSLDIEARNGTIQRELPVLLALTLASKGLDFTPNRKNVRYERISIPMQISEGMVSTEAFELDGPDVRVFASGTLDVARPPHRVDAEVAVFLFRPVDRAIGAIPVLNTILLGDFDNLVAAYFELDGPWEDPVAESKPLRTFTRGSLDVMKGVPRVVLRGVEMLGGMLGGDEKPAPKNDGEPRTEPEAAPGSGGSP